MTIVQRDDLSQRTTLSKSALTTFDMCGQKAWLEIHHRRPFIGNPDVTFGSCVDAGAELLMTYARAGQTPDMDRAMAAAASIVERDKVEVHEDEVRDALESFGADVLPRYDWSHVRLQVHIRVPLLDWGEVDGHPDIILPGAVRDVKTSKRAKDTARTVELGLYSMLVAEDTGKPVESVGYLTFVRTKKPYWQDLSTAVTPEFLDWTSERVASYVRAVRADELLNRRAAEPVNWTFPGGPKNAGLCGSCQYAPVMGGPCRMAPIAEEETHAA